MLRIARSFRVVSQVHPKFQARCPVFASYNNRHFSTNDETKNGDSKEAEPEVTVEQTKTVDEKAALQAEVKELKERVLRSLAEEENVRRIAKRDVDNAHAYANVSFAKAMLEVADDLERALANIPAEKKNSEDNTLKSLIQGIEMTDKNLSKIFSKFGIIKYGKVDEQFDPNFHDALYQIPDAEKAGTIGQVVKSGYKIKDRVIRAAQVGARTEPPK